MFGAESAGTLLALSNFVRQKKKSANLFIRRPTVYQRNETLFGKENQRIHSFVALWYIRETKLCSAKKISEFIHSSPYGISEKRNFVRQKKSANLFIRCPKEYQRNPLRFIEDITRWREDMDFMFEWQELYLTSERSERVRYSSCHENIKSISSS